MIEAALPVVAHRQQIGVVMLDVGCLLLQLASALIALLSVPPSFDRLTGQRVRLEQSFGWPQVAGDYAELLGTCERVVP